MRIEEEDDDDDVFRDTNYDELLAGSEFSGGEDPLPAKRSKNSKGKQKEVATLGGEREDDTPRASVARMRTRASGKNGNMKEKPTPRIPSSTSKPHRHQETNDGEGKIASRLRKPIETPQNGLFADYNKNEPVFQYPPNLRVPTLIQVLLSKILKNRSIPRLPHINDGARVVTRSVTANRKIILIQMIHPPIWRKRQMKIW